MSKLNFDANKVKPQEALDPIPSNWYNASVTKTELKPTKAKPGSSAGERLEVEFTVLDGEYKGRKVFDGFNIKNANPVAADIGQQQLSALCHATGVLKVTDTAQLHDKPIRLKVGLENARVDTATGNTYDARNVYKGCERIEGATTAAAPAGGAPAWAGKKADTPPPVKTPPGKKAAAAAAPVWRLIDGELVNGEFWVAVTEGEAPSDLKVPDILEMLGKGMPLDTAVMLQGGDEEWKTAGDFFVLDEPEAAPAEEKVAPPAGKTPPGKKETAPAKATNAPPWAKK